MLINEAMVQKASELFKVHPRDILSHSRFHFLLPARYALCTALRMQGLSFIRIGKLLGRDHSTVINAVKQAERMMVDDPTYREKVIILNTIPLEKNDVA